MFCPRRLRVIAGKYRNRGRQKPGKGAYDEGLSMFVNKLRFTHIYVENQEAGVLNITQKPCYTLVTAVVLWSI